MSAIVECRSDHEYAQRPLAFTWQGQRREVIKVLNAWRSPAGKHFQILSADQNVFTLTYLEADDLWSVEETVISTNLDSNKESS